MAKPQDLWVTLPFLPSIFPPFLPSPVFLTSWATKLLRILEAVHGSSSLQVSLQVSTLLLHLGDNLKLPVSKIGKKPQLSKVALLNARQNSMIIQKLHSKLMPREAVLS